MRLPNAVLRQEQLANEAIEQFKAQQDAALAGAVAEPEPAAPAAEPEPAAPATPPKEREDYKAQYFSLKGKYDAEVPRMAAQIRELQNELRSLRQQAQAAPAAPPAIATPDPREKFDPTLIDAVDALAQQRAREMVAPVVGALQKSEHSRFVERVAALVPDYQQIDLDPQFEAWMSEPDVLSGQTRQELLNDAAMKMDARRVVAFYQTFKSMVSGAKAAPVVVPPAPVAPTPPPVVPAQTGSPGAPGQAKVWTAAEVNAFYAAVSKGHYRGREAQAAQIEAEIVRANQEGRVR